MNIMMITIMIIIITIIIISIIIKHSKTSNKTKYIPT
jgi:preprotein translocase subunit SecG